MSAITTHVLDTSCGRPASGLRIELQVRSGADWKTLGVGVTDENGRCGALMGDAKLQGGGYRLIFDAGSYYRGRNTETFYSEIPIVFEIVRPDSHYHVPLLISPFGYSTYRGS
ncbi:MAG: hydroxyisourate hydrolase [Candidatus Acidiferrales bacterium]